MCTSTLIRKLFDEKKFTASRAKTREVAVNVIVLFAVQLTIDDFKKGKLVSVLVDASNHKAIKLVPVLVRYFSTTTELLNLVLFYRNQAVERAFSWTKSRNKLDIKTVEASLIIKTCFNNTSVKNSTNKFWETSSWIS
ncbi:hypothetical protein QTP88_010892 [Uroleucon formosanum]